MQELLGLVRRRGDPGALAQLQHRLVRGRELAARAGHEEPLLVAHERQVVRKRLLDGCRQPGDVFAEQGSDRRHRARVARGVAPARLDLRRADDNLVAELGDRPVGASGHEPAGTAPHASSFERERRLALVGDEHEQVGFAFRAQGELERLHGIAPGHRGVERRPAAGEEKPRVVREALVSRHLRQPFRLRSNRPPCLLAVHEP